MLRVVLKLESNEAFKRLCELPLTEDELIELTTLNEEELMQLLFLCGVQTYNDLPLVACTENELRLAYSIWRANELDKKWQPYKKASKRISKLLFWMKSYMERGHF